MAIVGWRSTGVAPGVRGRARAADLGLMKEWRFVLAVLGVALVLSALPYIFAYASAPPDKQFMGIMLDVPDHAQYFAWMRDFTRSNLAADRLTPEPNAPAFFNLLWWSMGRLEALTGLGYAALFQVLRVAAVIAVVGATWALIRLTVETRVERRLALILSVFGGGLGVVWIAAKYLLGLGSAPFPADIYTAEPNTFLIMLGYPHLTLALALLVAVFALVLLAQRQRRVGFAVAAGVVTLTLGLQHTYDLITIYAVLGIYGLLTWLRDRRFPRFLFVCGFIVAGFSAPPALYSVLLVRTNPVWGQVLDQFDGAGVFTPNVLQLPVLLGIPFLLALVAFRPAMLRSRRDPEMFVAAWFVAHFILVYLPLSFQIHLLLGWQVPIAILAATTVNRLGPVLSAWTKTRATGVLLALLACALLTNVYLFAWRFVELRRYQAPYYLSRDQVAALTWIGAHTTSSDVVLSDLELGQYVPMLSDARTFVGHWANTLNYDEKIALADAVFDAGESDALRRSILARFAVTYVVVDGANGEASPFADRSPPYLAPIFTSGRVTIYEVLRDVSY